MAHFGRRFGNAFGHDLVDNRYPVIQAGRPSLRDLSWDQLYASDEVYFPAADGEALTDVVTDGTRELTHVPDDIRQYVEVWVGSARNVGEHLGTRHFTSPLDRVKSAWAEVAGDPVSYALKRGTASGGPYTTIKTFDSGEDTYEHITDDLADDTYYGIVTVADEAGNTANSGEQSQAISSAPEPPTSISVSHNDGNGETTISWTKSTSGDAAGYYLRSGDPVNLDDSPTDLGDVASKVIDNSATTGHVEYLVTCYDAGGNEGMAFSAMVSIDLTGGAEDLRPNRPTMIHAWAAAGGEIEVLARYDSRGEGATATSIRMYTNNGAGGAMDWGTPVATENLTGTASVRLVSLTSSGLTGGLTYDVGIRSRTDGGVEDENTDTVEVTTDSTAPTAPTLSLSAV